MTLMNEGSLTIVEMILLGAFSLHRNNGSFSAEDLVVAVWTRFPDSFGLQGYANYPDSNRVLTKIMGTSGGLRARGWISKIGTKRYRITEVGLVRAQELERSLDGGEGAGEPQRLAEISRPLVSVLRRLLTSTAFRKFSTGETLSFSDVSAFWNISPRTIASQLVVRVQEAEMAVELATAHMTSDGLRLPGEAVVVTQHDLSTLRRLSESISSSFQKELDVIRARTDERRL
jgi:hypothetical protein